MPSRTDQTMEVPMTDLPTKELHDAIKAAAVSAECADPVHATAKAIEAFTKSEFSSADQIDAWFSLQRVKNPKLWEVADPVLDPAAAATKGATNPWSPNYKGTVAERNAAIASWVKRHGTASAARAASQNNVDIAARPLRA
jgi:hypothetical protein